MDLLELGKKPISKENPVGDDPRSFPEYEFLQEEVGKLSSLSALSGVDWQKISDLSQDILATKSKHLLTAMYLNQSLVSLQGLEGMAIGTAVLKDLLENFWEDLFPGTNRMRARKNAFEWWINIATNAVANLQGASLSKKDLKEVTKNIEAIESFIQEHIEDAPTLFPLIQGISTLTPSAEPRSTEEPASKPDTQQPALTPVTAAPAQMVETISSDDPMKLLNAGLDLMGQASNIWMKQEALTPHPFLINRIAAWLPVDSLPPADGSKTMIPPPDPQLVSTLDNNYREGRWRDLLDAAESRIRQYLFWLDLSYYTAKALEGLGRSDLSTLIAGESSNFVKRLSGLEKLQFSDGTPFANDETLDWIKELQQGAMQGEVSPATMTHLDDEMSKFFKKAKKDLKENKVSPVLSEFQAKRNQTASSRDRLFWDMGFCTLFISTKYNRLIVPYLHEILNTITQFRIEDWEPGLAAEALTLVLTGLKKQKGDSETGTDYKRLSEEIINRLSLLNPVKAMEYVQ